MDTKEDSHPVLVREMVQPDGSRQVSLRVFCAKQNESVDLDVCRRCPTCVDIDGDDSGGVWVRCARSSAEASSETAACVGAILKAAVICVREDVAIVTIAAILVERELPHVYVVESTGLLLGAVRDVDLLRARVGRVDVVAAQDMMSTAVRAREELGVHDALLGMASRHARQTAVITRDGILIGALVDVTLLEQWNRKRRTKHFR
ncbi:MAG: CBS domain-containing protein [Polyangiaceae bacterium]